MTVAGWGAGQWGASPWGAGSVGLQVLQAVPVRDDLVRVTFSEPPQYTRELGPNDASNPRRFSVTPVSTSRGRDGLPPRPVTPCRVDVSSVNGGGGAQLDVWVDRSFSPSPSLYLLAANQLAAFDGSPLDPTAASVAFFGLASVLVPNDPARVATLGDFAQPDTLDALQKIGLDDPELLGTLPSDSSGDYASDTNVGLVSYRKRLFRRMSTRKGSFLHLPGYGVGVPDLVKQVGRAEVRTQIAADAESQARLEPETVSASASFASTVPGLWVLALTTVTRVFGVVTVSAPFSPTG